MPAISDMLVVMIKFSIKTEQTIHIKKGVVMQVLTSALKVMPLLLINYTYCADNAQTISTSQKKPIMHAQKKITTVIFDLDGVLFQRNKTAFAQKVGLGKITKYTLLNWANPETTCLNTLHTISCQESNQPHIPLIHRGKKMPCCIIDWQLGHKSHTQVRNELEKHLEALDQKNHFKNSQEKELVQRMLDVSIDPQYLNDIVKPTTAMIELAKELKNRNYKLIILSNLAQEQYDLFQKTYPEITQLFDDIIISAQVKMLKPNNEIYQHLLDRHTLTAQECIFIDNQKENVDGAQQKGIHGIWHKNMRTTRMSLEKLGV